MQNLGHFDWIKNVGPGQSGSMHTVLLRCEQTLPVFPTAPTHFTPKVNALCQIVKTNVDPVVQSIVSLMSLLMISLLSVVAKVFSDTFIFLLQKCE